MFIGALIFLGLSVHFPFDLYRIQLPLFTSGVLLPYFFFVETTEIARTSRLVSRLTGYQVQPAIRDDGQG